jgi:aldehyde dehydrogenase (NAD+)
MKNALKFYVDGAWTAPSGTARLPVIDPCTEEPFAEVALGTADDVDRAVGAARRAFPSFSRTTSSERVVLIQRILEQYMLRYDDMARTISREIGAPGCV